jgi:hypothetical protein
MICFGEEHNIVFCRLQSTELLEDGNVVLVHLLGSFRASLLPGGTDLLDALLEAGSLLLAGSFEVLDDVAVLPADLGEHVAENGLGALGAEAAGSLRLGDDDAGALVGDVGGDTLVGVEAAESSVAALGSEGEHTADDAAEDGRGAAEVEGTLLGVGQVALAEEVSVLNLVADFLTGDVELVGADDGDSLAEEELLGNDGSSATHDVVLEVDDCDVRAVSLRLLALVAGNVGTGGSTSDVTDHFLVAFFFLIWRFFENTLLFWRSYFFTFNSEVSHMKLFHQQKYKN